MPWKERLIGIKLMLANSVSLGSEHAAKGAIISERTHPNIWAKYQTSAWYQRKFAPVMERYFEPGLLEPAPVEDEVEPVIETNPAPKPKKTVKRRKKKTGGE